jgi:hypothetical protein
MAGSTHEVNGANAMFLETSCACSNVASITANHKFMGQQTNKIQKRRRRLAYVERKKIAAKVKAKPVAKKAAAKKAAPAPAAA